MRMTNNELNELIKSKYSPINGLNPIIDGIVDEKLYRKSKHRVLWILWAPYDDYKSSEGPDNPCQEGFYNKKNYSPGTGGWDCRTDINEKINLYSTIPTWKIITKISSRILFKDDWNEMNYLIGSLKSIAFININKCPAGHTSPDRWRYFECIYASCRKVLFGAIRIYQY